MARAKGIPLVSSVDFPDPSKINLHQVIVDGYSGKVILNPAKSTINFYKAEQKKIQIHAKGLKKNQIWIQKLLMGLRQGYQQILKSLMK